jgi:RNA-binding protein YlmH
MRIHENDKQFYLARFNSDPARKLLFSKVLDRFFLCGAHGENAFTHFYDPASCAAFMQALNTGDAHTGVCISAFGGASGCERQMLGFSTGTLNTADFPIDRLRMVYNLKFHTAPRHRDILGAVLGLGIDRSRVGDIVTRGDCADMFVCADIGNYICGQLKKAGQTPVNVTVSVEGENDAPAAPGMEKIITAASLRVDALAAAVFHLSRGQASSLVTAEKVFVNWALVIEPGKILREGDMLTVRGLGRAQVLSTEGKTKKERIRVLMRCF